MALFFPKDLTHYSLEDQAYPTTWVWEQAKNQLTPRRIQRIETVAANRTFEIIPVLDHLYDRGNISAVLRTTEGLGIGGAIIYQPHDRFKESERTTAGAHKWLLTRIYREPEPLLADLEASGYEIWVTVLDSNSRPINEIKKSKPVALFFGNEREGVSSIFRDKAQEKVLVPMSGFVESFNISVAAALCLWILKNQLGKPPFLSPEEILYLKAHFAAQTSYLGTKNGSRMRQ